jgi:hypothetical protein
MLKTRKVQRKISMENLFMKLAIDPRPNNVRLIDFPLKVKTPHGYKQIVNLFTTEKQKRVTTYFSNGKTLTSSNQHLLKVGEEWKKVEELHEGDYVTTEKGTTKITKKVHLKKDKVLYDMSVDEVHCYYSNGLLSHNSWCLINLGAAAVKAGYTVCHYTLELSEDYVGKRYDAIFTGIDAQQIHLHKDKVAEAIEKLSGKLIIKEYPMGKVGPNTIESHIQKCRDLKHPPNLVIIDYVDLLKSKTRSIDPKDAIDDVYTAVKGLARELKIPIWTVSQVNRCHNVNDTVETPSGSIKIGNLKVGDEVMTHRGFRKVTRVYPIQRQPTYRIKLKNGKEINVSADHILPTQYGQLKSISTGLSVGNKLFTKK